MERCEGWAGDEDGKWVLTGAKNGIERVYTTSSSSTSQHSWFLDYYFTSPFSETELSPLVI